MAQLLGPIDIGYAQQWSQGEGKKRRVSLSAWQTAGKYRDAAS